MAPPANINNNLENLPSELIVNNFYNQEEFRNINQNLENISRPVENIRNQQNSQPVIINSSQNIQPVIINSSPPAQNQQKPRPSYIAVKAILPLILLVGILLAVFIPIFSTSSASNNQTFEFTTNEVDYEQGSMIPLTKLNVKCEVNQALCAFNMDLPSDTTMAYEFKCVSVNSTSSEVRYTRWNGMRLFDDYLFSSGNYLDRHNVDCGNDSVISDFVLSINTKDRTMRYVYTCLKTNVNKCQIARTKQSIGFDTKDDYARSYYLSKQSIVLSDNQVLQRFQLISIYDAQSRPYFKYEYRYCSLQ